MTALRPEREGGLPPGEAFGEAFARTPGEPPAGTPGPGLAPGSALGDTAEFEAVVESLADPLSDPIPSFPRASAPYEPPPTQPGPAQPAPPADGTAGAAPRARTGGRHSGRPAPEPTGPVPDAAPAGAHAAPTAPAPAPASSAPAPGAPAPTAHAAPAPATTTPTPPSPPSGSPGGTLALTDGPVASDQTVRLAPVRDVPAEPVRTPGSAPEPVPPEPAGVPEPGPAERTVQLRVLPAAAERLPARTPLPAEPVGGRAERRRAEREAARRGARRAGPEAGRGTAGAELAIAAPGAPLSRVEARRAARAAKDSPAVVVSRVTGELFITLGVLMLLFVTYQLWWTNVRAHQQAGAASRKILQQWDGSTADKGMPDTFAPGTGFAIIYIPKLDVKAPIAEGTDKTTVLDHGEVGHYSGAQETAMPWDKTGNFALAAHRNTHGEPFRYINKLVKGDQVIVETQKEYYTYTVTSTLPQTSPSNVSVIAPVPPQSGFTKPGRYITLTTCTPEFTSTYRLIVWGKLTDERPRSKGAPAALGG